MKFIDGVLPPATIKTGVYIYGGLAYFVVGSFSAVIKPENNGDLLDLISIIESVAAPLRRPSGDTTQNYTQPTTKGLV